MKKIFSKNKVSLTQYDTLFYLLFDYTKPNINNNNIDKIQNFEIKNQNKFEMERFMYEYLVYFGEYVNNLNFKIKFKVC